SSWMWETSYSTARLLYWFYVSPSLRPGVADVSSSSYDSASSAGRKNPGSCSSSRFPLRTRVTPATNVIVSPSTSADPDSVATKICGSVLPAGAIVTPSRSQEPARCLLSHAGRNSRLASPAAPDRANADDGKDECARSGPAPRRV